MFARFFLLHSVEEARKPALYRSEKNNLWSFEIYVHSSFSTVREKAKRWGGVDEQNVLHDGKTKAKRTKERVPRKKIDKMKLPLLPHGTIMAHSHIQQLRTSVFCVS